jgi:hypothetical protein
MSEKEQDAASNEAAATESQVQPFNPSASAIRVISDEEAAATLASTPAPEAADDFASQEEINRQQFVTHCDAAAASAEKAAQDAQTVKEYLGGPGQLVARGTKFDLGGVTVTLSHDAVFDFPGAGSEQLFVGMLTVSGPDNLAANQELIKSEYDHNAVLVK